MTEPLTPDEEYVFYARPANQEPASRPRRRRARLGAPVPVRSPQDVLAKVRERDNPSGPGARKLGFVSLGTSASGRSARDADEMLAGGFGRE